MSHDIPGENTNETAYEQGESESMETDQRDQTTRISMPSGRLLDLSEI